MTVTANDGTDQTGNVVDAMLAGERLPAGDIRITSDLVSTASQAFAPGIRLQGASMLGTRIIADYDGDPARGAIVRLDLDKQSHYSVGSVISDLTLMPAPGRAGLNGVSLTAAWMVTLERVRIAPGCRAGVVTPFRPDINPVSDYYQCFALDMKHCWVEGCAGNGVDFGAGQSPGIFRVFQCQSIENGGVGLRSTTGQCEIRGSVFSYNNTGGIEFDTAEGPSMVADVTQCEIQDNGAWGLNLVRSRGLRLIGNRFLSQTYSAPVSGSPQNGTSFMRQQVHVNLGSGPSGEVYDLLAEGNLHRSINGPIPTTVPVYAYDASVGSLSAAFPCRFVNNDFGPNPGGRFDGVTQNSTGMMKFVNLSAPTALIVDPH